MHICDLRRSRETMDLSPENYASSADESAAPVMAVQANKGVTDSIATNPCEKAFPRSRRIFFLRQAGLSPAETHGSAVRPSV